MADQRKSIREVVTSAVAGELDIPEFQRAFQWPPFKVRDLIDSLLAGLPRGCFPMLATIWDHPGRSACRKGALNGEIVDC